jgi:hypothetical protein
VNVAGGSETATYYVSADYEGEIGAYKLRGFDFDSVSAARNGEVPEEQDRPNELDKITLRANGTAKVASNADLQVSVGYVTSDLRLVENDNTLNSVTPGHRAFHRRAHRQLAAAPLAVDPGDLRLRRDQPRGYAVVADRRDQRRGLSNPG